MRESNNYLIDHSKNYFSLVQVSFKSEMKNLFQVSIRERITSHHKLKHFLRLGKDLLVSIHCKYFLNDFLVHYFSSIKIYGIRIFVIIINLFTELRQKRTSFKSVVDIDAINKFNKKSESNSENIFFFL